MPQINRYEQQFLDAMKDIFIGAKVEGDSGYINLMRIKSRYYTEGVFPHLKKDVDAVCKPFEAAFREELFDKLYDFFKRYFSDSGSIYFCHTPQHANVYEKVYTDERDVMLFWKTHMLYYVKTDRLFNSLDVEIDGSQFHFDALEMEHKRSNEKRELLYSLKDYKAGKIVLEVTYSEKGRKTKTDDIVKGLKSKAIVIDEETLEKAFRVFEKQSEVDYFINKNAGAFLKEQFDLWMYQYIFVAQSDFDEKRLKQLQAIKRIANNIIDFIAQFEDELVRVWNKPKFVLNSHYIITLDKITNANLRKKLFAHSGIKAQVQEWRDLGIAGDDFNVKALTEQHQYLPLDTKYFPDLELDVLAQFDDLDAALDGWLIHSENYQALSTIVPKFKKRVRCVHIDPPYNTDSSGFLYTNNYRHSSWLTMMDNRVQLSLALISSEGSILCHIDENEYERLQLLFEQYEVPNAGTIIWDKRNPMNAGMGIAKQHEYIVWRTNQETPIYLRNDVILEMLEAAAGIVTKFGGVTEKARKEYAKWVKDNSELTGGEKAYHYLDAQGKPYQSVSLRAPEPRTDPKFHEPLLHPVTGRACPVPPNGFSRTPETLLTMVKANEIIFGSDEIIQPRQRVPLTGDTSRQISSVIQDARKGKADLDRLGLEFPYCHPVSLYKKLIGAATDSTGDIVLDHFAGSGTTAHAVIELNREAKGDAGRKYILVEMGEHFQGVILPRIKKLIYSENWKSGIAQHGKGISHFAKYFDLEQYEDALRCAKYQDSDMFATTDAYNSYVFMRDLKMLGAISLDKPKNKVNVNLEKLYSGIDLAETLSCVTGKGIKRITKKSVEFQDGTTASLTDPDWELIKPLVWW